MTVLIFTPTFGDGPRAETIQSVSQQQCTVPTVHEVSYHNPYPGERKLANVLAQYQRAWEICLAGDYDALLTVEHDMVLPANAVQTLYETEAPVVYGVYMLRHGTPTLNTLQYINNRNLGMSLSLYPDELADCWKRGWAKVCGVGWGCTLIRREIIERLTVHSVGDDAGDMTFATDCVRAGILQIARFDVPCDHITPDGRVLKPREMGGLVSRVLALQNVNAHVNFSSMPLKKDRYYTIPVDVANDLARAGYVRIMNDTEEQPVTAREMATDPKPAIRSKRKAQ